MPGDCRILIVEDDESVAAHFAESLRTEGYDVHVAHDGGAALARAIELAEARRPVQVVLLDLRLPDRRPALSLIPQLRRSHRFAEIVIATGESRSETMYEAFTKHRVFDFLEKPVELLELKIAVERACLRSADRQQIVRSHQALIVRNQELMLQIKESERRAREIRASYLRAELARTDLERLHDRLLQVVLGLQSAADLEQLLETAVEGVQKLVPTEATVVFYHKVLEELDPFGPPPEEDLSSLIHRIYRPGGTLAEGMLERVGRRLARGVTETGQTVRLPDRRPSGEPGAEVPRRLDGAVRSILCVPLVDAGRCVMGVIQLFNRIADEDEIAARGFTDTDVRAIETIAAFLARGISRQHELGQDPLTQVSNRRVLGPRTGHEIEKLGKPERPGDHQTWFGVTDVDHFGDYNKRHGHLTGDRILRTVARAIAGALREHDFVARFGGDEFCLILKRIEDGAAARAVLERVRRAVEQLPVPSSKDVESLTVSVAGTRLCADDTFESVFDRADRALKRLKRSEDTRNTVAIEPAPCGENGRDSPQIS